MRSRFQTQCAYCRDWITVGAQCEHAYGGYFHWTCLREMRAHRAAEQARLAERERSRHALAASGKIGR